MVLLTELTHEVLDPQAIQDVVNEDSRCGTVTFTCEMRTLDGRRKLTHVDSNANVAAELVRSIAADEAFRYGANVALVHRLGELHPGDIYIVCVAACKDKMQAFECCRRMVERLNEVPIWQREYDPDDLAPSAR